MLNFIRLHFYFVIIGILLTYACNESKPPKNARQLQPLEYLDDITPSWNIKGLKNKPGYYQLYHADNDRLKTGQTVYVRFKEAKLLKYIEFVDNKSQISYKLYLDGKYVGRYQANKKIGIDRTLREIRLILISSDKDRVVKGWDSKYNYIYIKDTAKIDRSNQTVKLKFSSKTPVEFIAPIKSNFLKKKGTSYLPFVNELNYMILKEKHSSVVYEQIVDFKTNGSFFIYHLKAESKKKEIISEYSFSGNWKVLSGKKSKYSLQLEGKFSAVNQEDMQANEIPYQLKIQIDSLGRIKSKGKINDIFIDLPDWVMVYVHHFNNDFIIDIPYSTTNNITGTELYTCNRCYLRYVTIKALLEVQKALKKRELRIKLWDCYRPFDVQKILYKAFPVSGYVADTIGGSIHNRGTAIDLTLVDKYGNELEMGSEYDELSIKSNHGYRNLPDTVLQNRKLFRETMEANNFVTIRLEWWHYNYIYARRHLKLNDPFPCDD